MNYSWLLCLLLSAVVLSRSQCTGNYTAEPTQIESSLEKLVRMFSKPGAFKRTDRIFGENSIEGSVTSCPDGDEGLDCRRAEARRSVDCPRVDQDFSSIMDNVTTTCP
ncbi:uncharacterized protein LOC105698917 isoform X2 [Orussus abietinus]|uniref:uncharacterized protein LOC105698917 isoform X2 n=1 Tax=Orussus abietinus TaxID=222816 RepID=UPI000C7161B1|nr:uncharacterized protein LOC105698917 isoform X2 [Orussus abietinus]